MDKISIIVTVKNDDATTSALMNTRLPTVRFWETVAPMPPPVRINGSPTIACSTPHVKNAKTPHPSFVVSAKQVGPPPPGKEIMTPDAIPSTSSGPVVSGPTSYNIIAVALTSAPTTACAILPSIPPLRTEK